MAASMALLLFFIAAVLLLNVRPDVNGDLLPRIEFARFAPAGGEAARRLAVESGELASIGGFLAYRGYAALGGAVALSALALSLILLWRFAGDKETRLRLGLYLAAASIIAVGGALIGGSVMAQVATRIGCSEAAPLDPWEFCGHGRVATVVGIKLHYGFDRWVAALGSIAIVGVLFAIFAIAVSKTPKGLPAIASSRERCVTILLAAASAILVASMLLDRAFLQWAFAGYGALEKPPQDIVRYIAGTATFNGAVMTAGLALAWFIALLLLQRGSSSAAGAPDGAGSGDVAETGGLSLYNLSAILAPVLSAIATNMLGGQ
jgi:hypothetical protein